MHSLKQYVIVDLIHRIKQHSLTLKFKSNMLLKPLSCPNAPNTDLCVAKQEKIMSLVMTQRLRNNKQIKSVLKFLKGSQSSLIYTSTKIIRKIL